MRAFPRLCLVLVATLLLAGACGGDDQQPTAKEVAAEAAEQTEKAADKTADAAKDAAERGKEVAEDVADGPDVDAPSVEITSPEDGASVAGGTVELKILVTGITIVAADGDSSGKTGHFHVFVDREPMGVGEVMPKDADIVHSAANPVVISGLTPGTHELTVVLGDGNHRRIAAEALDQLTVTVT